MTQNDRFQLIKHRVVEYYEACLDRHGYSAEAVDWRSHEAQQLLFRAIKSMGIPDNSSILDVGSGLAHFYEFLSERGFSGTYTGVDLSARMIDQARRRRPQLDLRVGDILTESVVKPGERFDFVTASGLFSLRVGIPTAEFEQFIEAMIRRMFELSRVATIFNMVTKYVDFEVDRLYYADPARYFNFAKSLTRFVSLKHDYPAYSYTLALYTEGNEDR